MRVLSSSSADTAAALREEHAHDHSVRFYESDDFLVEEVAAFLREGLVQGESVIVIATEPHRARFVEAIRKAGLDAAAMISSRRFRLLDVTDTLAKFMTADGPDEARFEAHVGGVFEEVQTERRGCRVRAYGEMVDVLWREGKQRAAIQLEELWTGLQRRRPFTLHCAYAMANFYKEPAGLAQVAARHSKVLPSGTSDAQPHGETVRLLAAEVAQRTELERALRSSLEAVQQARARAELLYGVAQAVISAERVEQVFDVALDGIEQALGASRCSILTFDPDGVMRFKAWRGLSESYRRAVDGHSPWARDARGPESILIADVTTAPSMKPYLQVFEAENIRALGFIPLVASGRLLGKFMVYYDQPRTFAAQESAMASAIANQLASAIAHFEAVATLRETLRLNDLYAGVLAHDLRNPLAAIRTSAELLLRHHEGEADRYSRPLLRIINSGDRMRRMVDQLLDFTRVRVGQGFELRRTAADLGAICEQVVDEISSARPAWDIRLESTGSLAGSWDTDRLGQLVSNLVANAGQHGTPEAPVEVRADGSNADVVTLTVHNAGAIPDHVRPFLFDPLRRPSRGPGQKEGLGLGLFITRELANSHGGSVEFTSSEQEGTRFTVRLPRAPAG